MVTQELVDYIKTSFASGADDEAIKSELRLRGWANDDIDAAFVSARTGAPSPSPDAPSSGWHITKKEVFIAIGGLLVLGVAGVAGAYFLVPPKPEKVLATAATKMRDVHSFDYSGNLVLDITSQSGFFSLNTLVNGFKPASGNSKIAGATDTKFGVDFSGTADVADANNPKSAMNLDFTYTVFKFTMQMRYLDKIIYLKFTGLPKVPDYDLTQFSNVWLKLDPKDVTDQTGLDINPSTSLPNLTPGQQQQIRDLTMKSHFFNTITKLPDDSIDGKSVYHYALDVDMNGVRNYLHEVERIENSTQTTDTQLNNLAIKNAEIWVGKSDKMVYRMQGQVVDVPDPGATSSSPVQSGSINFVFNLRNFNNSTPIVAPVDYKNLIDVVKQFYAGSVAGDPYVASRDARRVSDVRMLQTALELSFNDNGKYPTSLSKMTQGSSKYLTAVPTAPQPPDGNCTAAQNNYVYTQKNGGTGYTLTFCVGQTVTGLNLAPGVHTASPTGIK